MTILIEVQFIHRPDHSARPWCYALHRLTETVLRIGVAMLVSFVAKLIPIDKPK